MLFRELRLDRTEELDLPGDGESNEFGSLLERARLGVMLSFDAAEDALVLLLGLGAAGADGVGGATEDLRERVEASVGTGGCASGFRVVVRVVRVIFLVVVALVRGEGMAGVAAGVCE
jgi:hypothetical protein